jgi:tyrosyl-tRNA synthetase
MGQRERDRRRGDRREGRRAIGRAEPVRAKSDEIVAVERFGRRAGEERMGAEPDDERLVDLTLAREPAVAVDRLARVVEEPVVEEGVPGPGVEGEELVLARPDPGDVGDAADIEDGDGFLETRGERGVEDRRERRPFAARRDVGRAEIGDDGETGLRCKERAVADLPGAALFRPVQDGVAVKADEVDGAEIMGVAQGSDRLGMDEGERALDLGDRPGAAEHAADRGAQRCRVGTRQGRAGLDMIAAVGDDESGVDAVHRGAAHQPDRAPQLGHVPVPICRGSEPVLNDAAHDPDNGTPILTRMSTPRSPFLVAAIERGFLHQCTDLEALDARLLEGPVTAYVGYDCTADSLHIGNLISIMLLRLFQQTGNTPIVLMGGGTTKVGDPSGKDEARRLLSEEDIAQNLASIRRTFDNFLVFGDGPGKAIMANNAEWLDELKYIPLLRDVGRHFSVNRMLTMDSVRLRLERDQPLSFLEFNYMVLQSYDFLELARRYDCALQMGGSDQWGNIVMGADLGRRVDDRALFGLTTPLITTSSGAKMGKTAQGAVWLGAHRLPPYDYWQFWRNTEDADVGRFLRLFTDLPLDEVTRLERLAGAEVNEAKKVLAFEATALCHGRAAAEAAAATAQRVFEEGGVGAELPTTDVHLDQLAQGWALINALAGTLVGSIGDARRQIRQGAVRVNDAPIRDELHKLTPADLRDGAIKLSVGKKRHALVNVVQ